MLIGVISDSHFKESLGYADHFEDRRAGEKKRILDAIVDIFEPCDAIVFNGDNLNSRHNSSGVIREFVEFLERFDGKEIFINAGNHEKFGDGRSALDFLAELKSKPKWHVFTNAVGFRMLEDGTRITICPYFHKPELGVQTDEEGAERLLSVLEYDKDKDIAGDILFVHHAISDTKVVTGLPTDIFHEIVLPRKRLEDSYKLVIGGHIHEHQTMGRTTIVGCTFANELGDAQKYVLTIDTKTMQPVAHKLPGRWIVKVTDPVGEKALERIKKNVPRDSIVKAVLTKRDVPEEEMAKTREFLAGFDASIILEQYPGERKKVHIEDGMLEFSVENLLALYAKSKGTDPKLLLSAWETIKD